MITALKVMLKTTWLSMKQEMRKIKQEIAQLNPEDMYQPKHLIKEKSEDQPMKSAEKKLEAPLSSIVKISGLSLEASKSV